MKEKLPVEEMKEMINHPGIVALHVAWNAYKQLGEDGKRKTVNYRGDPVIEMDIAAEKAIQASLAKSNQPWVIVGEEVGKVGSGNRLAVIDGLDGSSDGYLRDKFSTTVVALTSELKNIDSATYADFEFGGTVTYPTGIITFGLKGRGAYTFQIKDHLSGVPTRVLTSGCRTLDQNTRVYADPSYDPAIGTDVMQKALSHFYGFNIQSEPSSAIEFEYVARRSADAVIDFTRGNKKPNVEFPAVYRMIREAGGVMITNDGRDIGGKNFWQWGHGDKEYLPIIAAATPELADQIRERMNI